MCNIDSDVIGRLNTNNTRHKLSVSCILQLCDVCIFYQFYLQEGNDRVGPPEES